MMIILRTLFLVLLLVMITVQYNDPDGLFWMAVYGASALVPAMHLAGKNNLYIFGIAALLCLYAAVISFSGVTEYSHHLQTESLLQPMSPDKLYLEQSREFFGALIALALITIDQFLLAARD